MRDTPHGGGETPALVIKAYALPGHTATPNRVFSGKRTAISCQRLGPGPHYDSTHGDMGCTGLVGLQTRAGPGQQIYLPRSRAVRLDGRVTIRSKENSRPRCLPR